MDTSREYDGWMDDWIRDLKRAIRGKNMAAITFLLGAFDVDYFFWE